MQFTIFYEDKKACENVLNIFNTNHDVTFDIDELESYLWFQIRDATKIFTESYDNAVFQINIKVFHADKQSISASVELAHSSDNIFVCSLNWLSYLLNYLKYKEYNSIMLPYNFNVWIHEFAHVEDQKEIYKNGVYLKKLDNSVHYRLHAAFNLVVKLRNEGIATCIDAIFGNYDYLFISKYSDLKINFREFTGAKVLGSEFIDSSIDFNVFYRFSKYLILNTLYFKHAATRPIIQKLKQEGESIGENRLSYFDGTDILKKIYAIKIEEMIFINFTQSDILPFSVKFDKNLLHSIAEFARDREYDSINLKDYQIRKIIKLAKKTGLEKVFYLSDVVGYPLSDHDINALYTKWKKEDGDSILLHQFVDKVYTRWCEEKDLLSTYQLSYFFKHDDIIHDAVPFFGKIDDLIVLSW
jgi:hypothetical protein